MGRNDCKRPQSSFTCHLSQLTYTNGAVHNYMGNQKNNKEISENPSGAVGALPPGPGKQEARRFGKQARQHGKQFEVLNLYFIGTLSEKWFPPSFLQREGLSAVSL